MSRALWLCVMVATTPTFAAQVALSEDWSDSRWQGYPQTLDTPRANWLDEQFVVDVVVNWTSGMEIDNRAVKVKVDGDALKLCYGWTQGATARRSDVSGALAPVRLVFAVTQLPRRTYTVSVAKNCP